jgi:hypothetical protein
MKKVSSPAKISLFHRPAASITSSSSFSQSEDVEFVLRLLCTRLSQMPEHKHGLNHGVLILLG